MTSSRLYDLLESLIASESGAKKGLLKELYDAVEMQDNLLARFNEFVRDVELEQDFTSSLSGDDLDHYVTYFEIEQDRLHHYGSYQEGEDDYPEDLDGEF